VASRPGQVRLADLIYIATAEGWLYLAAVLGLHARNIVGWPIRERLYTEINLEALNMAIERQRPAPDVMHHSDNRFQYGAEAYRLLRDHAIGERHGQSPQQCADGKLDASKNLLAGSALGAEMRAQQDSRH
jgi:transposase InsO family protein